MLCWADLSMALTIDTAWLEPLASFLAKVLVWWGQIACLLPQGR